MLEILIGSIVLTVVAAIAAVAMNSSNVSNIDVIADYHAIKIALTHFRKDKRAKCQTLDDLRPYLINKDMPLSPYALSDDEHFLIVSTPGLKVTPEELVRKIGSNAHVIGSKAYLPFLGISKVSAVDAIAKIKYSPTGLIYTTTPIEYDPTDSVAEDNFIAQATWDNNRRYFSTPGRHVVRLRIKDINDNWSDWAAATIEVHEKHGFCNLITGPDSVYLVGHNGKTYCMGTNEYGQLGIDLLTPQDQMVHNLFINLVEQVACGSNHTLYKTLDNRLLATGRNTLGQLGTGNRTDWKTPRELWGLENIKQIATGNDFSVALTHDGKVFTWGDNELLQLGTDKFTSLKAPRELENVQHVTQIACGNEHVLALKSDGTVVAWGSNSFGQLAVGFKEKSLLPTPTKLTQIVKVIAGKNTSFAITSSGKVIACGQNNRNQLAIHGHQIVAEPEEIQGLRGITDIQSKGNFSLALSHGGDVYTWGKYSTQDDRHYDHPTKLDHLKSVKYIGATTSHGYAVTEDDELLKWSAAINVREVVMTAQVVAESVPTPDEVPVASPEEPEVEEQLP